MKNLRNLGQSLNSALARIEHRVNKRKIRAATLILRELIAHTPVDTSEALSNWVVGLGRVDRSTPGPWVPGQFGSTRAESADMAYSLGKLVLADARPGQAVFLTNSTPYIRELDAGKSRQEPAGFVRRAVIVGRSSIREALPNGR